MNIYVSNINFRTQEESLYNLFAAYGEVTSARIITDRETGRSRGFGFVEMPNDDEANAAIEALHGKPFEEKEINVSEARPREERPRTFGGNRGGYANRGGYGNRSYNNDRGAYGRGYNNDRGGYGNRGSYGNRNYNNDRNYNNNRNTQGGYNDNEGGYGQY